MNILPHPDMGKGLFEHPASRDRGRPAAAALCALGIVATLTLLLDVSRSDFQDRAPAVVAFEQERN